MTVSFKNFGFKNLVTPPQNEHLNVFKNDIYDMIRNLEFTNIRNEFLDHLNKDVECIQSKKVLVFTDKSRNLYKLSRESYQNLLHGNITQTYKKACKNAQRDIDRRTKSFVRSLNIDDKMDGYVTQTNRRT